MNIYLIPYTTARHVVVALPIAAAGLLAWWFTLTWVVVLGPVFHRWGFWWAQWVEGGWFLANTSAAVAFASVLVEGSLRRRALHFRFGYAGLAAMIAFGFTWLPYLMWTPIAPYLGTSAMREVLSDGSLVTLRYKLPIWMMAGMASGLGPLIARIGQELLARRFKIGVDPSSTARTPTWSDHGLAAFHHLGGGAAGGMAGAAIWHTLGLYDWIQGDLYLGAALGTFAWGLTHGLLVWGIPNELYAGWVRVLSPERFGLRIPIPHVDGSPAERFVGHFPRGLDLYLPAEQEVAEIHVSFVVDQQHNYAVRGLSVQPTVVKRFLERIDLRYDPRRPAPLETSMGSEDRILVGENGQTELEFLMLPKEER